LTGDAGQDFGEPSLPAIIELRGLSSMDMIAALATAIGAGEQPRLSARAIPRSARSQHCCSE
jgi:hypothetical protein